MASADGELFNDIFIIESLDVHNKDADGNGTLDKKFDKVSRIDAKSNTYDTMLTLDVNMELYPLRENERVRLLLATKLGGDDEVSDLPGYDPTKPLSDRADKFDYIMYGKIYKYSEHEETVKVKAAKAGAEDKEKILLRATVYASFGGLLMSLKGEPQMLGARAFTVDASLYLFLAKVDRDAR